VAYCISLSGEVMASYLSQGFVYPSNPNMVAFCHCR